MDALQGNGGGTNTNNPQNIGQPNLIPQSNGLQGSISQSNLSNITSPVLSLASNCTQNCSTSASTPTTSTQQRFHPNFMTALILIVGITLTAFFARKALNS